MRKKESLSWIVALVLGIFIVFYSAFCTTALGEEANKPDEKIQVYVSSLTSPKWSPDGKKIAFVAERKIFNSNGSWQPSEGIWTIDVDGNNLKSIISTLNVPRVPPAPRRTSKDTKLPGDYKLPESPKPPPSPMFSSRTFFDWSPDGNKIVFIDSPTSFSDDDEIYFWTVNSDGTNLRSLLKTSGKKLPMFLQCLKNGKIIYNTREDTSQFLTLNSDGKPGSERFVLPQFYSDNPSFSQDGSKLVFKREQDIFVMIRGYAPKNLTDVKRSGECDWPCFSPDGQKIAFAFRGSRGMGGAVGSGYRIWVINVNGTNTHPLTTDKEEKKEKDQISSGEERIAKRQYYDETFPYWSPDGTKIAFLRSNTLRRERGNSEPELWIMDADGKNQTRLYPLKNDEKK